MFGAQCLPAPSVIKKWKWLMDFCLRWAILKAYTERSPETRMYEDQLT